MNRGTPTNQAQCEARPGEHYANSDDAKQACARDLSDKLRSSLPWHECSIEEKLDRIRFELIQTRETARRAHNVAYRAVQTAESHQHGVSGGVLLPAGGGRLGGGYPEEQLGQANHPFDRLA